MRKKQNITIDDDDKFVHLVGCAQYLGIFEAEWVEKWEVSLDRTWSVVRDQWVA